MPRKKSRFVICLRSGSYRASLEPRKVYRVLEDPGAETHSLLRVIDDSGEDYLFPADLFVPIELPVKAVPAFSKETRLRVTPHARAVQQRDAADGRIARRSGPRS